MVCGLVVEVANLRLARVDAFSTIMKGAKLCDGVACDALGHAAARVVGKPPAVSRPDEVISDHHCGDHAVLNAKPQATSDVISQNRVKRRLRFRNQKRAESAVLHRVGRKFKRLPR